MNGHMYGTPPLSIEHESGGSFRAFDSAYNTYASHGNLYPEYPNASKSEAFDYNYWSPAATTTHNLLNNPVHVVLDQGQTTPSSSLQAMESLVPVPSVQLSQLHATTTISATHHHHHIHQHLYPSSTAALPSTPPTSHEPTAWLGSGDYQALHPTSHPVSGYRQYPTPCSLYSTNNFYEPSPSQWSTQPILPLKFESPYSPPSYFESSESFNHCQEQLTKDEPIDSLEQSNWPKPSMSSTPLNLVPPKNPLNGKEFVVHSLTFDYEDEEKRALICTCTRFHLGVRLQHDQNVNRRERRRRATRMGLISHLLRLIVASKEKKNVEGHKMVPRHERTAFYGSQLLIHLDRGEQIRGIASLEKKHLIKVRRVMTTSIVEFSLKYNSGIEVIFVSCRKNTYAW